MVQRTDSQRKAIEVYCRQVAEALRAEGHTMQDVIREIKKAEILPTQSLIKEIVWNGISLASVGKDSSTKLEKSEVSLVYEHVNNWLSRFGIYVPFPVDENKIWDNPMLK